ncbi:hypothetical protein [Streptomyces sp. NRRL F-5630]|uniref:hypothetical protein n=1 Tax=Streptomyces sp. NRRL F-5630 TaxID=1463864 RepID=UPI003D7161C4
MLNDAQRTVGNLVLAALAGDRDDLARQINQLPEHQVRDATNQALALLADSFRQSIPPHEWQALLGEARGALLLLDLEGITP